jgi:beta-xylosidase
MALVGVLASCSGNGARAPATDRADAAPVDAGVEAMQSIPDASTPDSAPPAEASTDAGFDAPTYENPVVSHDFPDPSVLVRPGSFVLYYTARDTASGLQCVSRAVSSTPAGPYVDTSSAPLVCQTAICGSIDPSPFVDDDGSAYLVWKSDENNPTCNTPPRIWSQPLTSDGISVVGSPTELLVRDQLWEGAVIEGPDMWKSGGAYYLFYSANRYDSADYAVGYGVCQGPSGPCQKTTLDLADGGSPAVLQSAGAALGPGGEQLFVDTSLALWVVYHAWTAPDTSYSGGGARSMRIDRVIFDAGLPIFVGPTTTPQTL